MQKVATTTTTHITLFLLQVRKLSGTLVFIRDKSVYNDF